VVQLTNLELNTSHCVVGRNLGCAQLRHLLRILVRRPGSAERERVAVQAIRVGSVLAQLRQRRRQLLAPSLQMGCASAQLVYCGEKTASSGLINSVSLGVVVDTSVMEVGLLVAIECVPRRDQRPCLFDASTTFINLPHESGRTQERHRVRLASTSLAEALLSSEDDPQPSKIAAMVGQREWFLRGSR